VSPTEIHIDEHGNIQTIDNPPPAGQIPVQNTAPQMPPPEMPEGDTGPAIPNLTPPPVPAMPPLPPPQLAPMAPPPVPSAPPPAAPAAEETLPPLPPAPPIPHIIKEERLEPLPPVSSVPQNTHAYAAPSQNPAMSAMPSTGQPEWAAPYDLVPMDPFNEGAMDEDVPSGRPMTPPHDQQTDNGVDEIGLGGPAQTAPPNVSPVAQPVDAARNAVESALAAAPFDPSFSPPVQSLNAQPLPNPQPIPVEQPPTAPQMPPMAHSDTPMLVLPGSGQPAPPPQAQQFQPIPEVSPAAPPPLPPPLMAAPGAVVPAPPQQ